MRNTGSWTITRFSSATRLCRPAIRPRNQYRRVYPRPWHLPEQLHVPTGPRSNGPPDQAARPKRPAFWYLSYSHPHPPLVPLAGYLASYRGAVRHRTMGTGRRGACLSPWRPNSSAARQISPDQIANIRRAFYALCTHIDHQLRLVIGTLREEMLLDDTIVLFTSRSWRHARRSRALGEEPVLPKVPPAFR